jgi:hypothetical protein
MSIFQFSANGTFNLRLVYEGEVKQTTPGTWEKSGPGVLSVSNEGNAPQTYYGEMDGRDFMFLWNFEHKNGLWFVRRPDKSTPLIQGNDFVFTNGDHLRLREVRGQSFLGTLTTGTEEMEVSGGYNQGVLNLHWIDKPNNVDGYAAFVVTPDWKDLYGIWWLNDFMSSPVGGRWATPGGEALAAASAAAGSAPPQPMPPPAAPPGGSPA